MRILVVAAASGALCTALACYSGEIEKISCPLADVQEGAKDAPPVDAPPGEGTATAGLTGGPCAADTDCIAGQCLTTEFLKALNPNVEAPGGLCSKMSCDDKADPVAQCGPEAACVDATAIAGVPLTLCVRLCKDSSDCRYTGGYGCYDTQIKDAGGAPIFACLPNSLVSAINCGDAICDTNEAATGSCPEDCK
ncbi:MAG: hypothetical protein FJ087_02350 [Deltaproteobacteria bacterium]|nr:hypothetical protein [Deltaproteobacteria bacterium]